MDGIIRWFALAVQTLEGCFHFSLNEPQPFSKVRAGCTKLLVYVQAMNTYSTGVFVVGEVFNA